MSTRWAETPVMFECAGASLVGVLAVPREDPQVGIVVVVGGPQYRVGSHRQFVLLSKTLAQAGIACLRFDYRGMGDSGGPRVSFEEVAEDIRAGVDELCRRVPSVRDVVLWGLCDGASASATYAITDRRVTGLVLFNPWVRTTQGAARATVTHYYARRLRDPAFWRKLATGGVALFGALRSLTQTVRRAAFQGGGGIERCAFPHNVLASLRSYPGAVLIGLSGNDAVAAEFKAMTAATPSAPALMRVEFEHADHTFSERADKMRVAEQTASWIRANFPRPGEPRGA